MPRLVAFLRANATADTVRSGCSAAPFGAAHFTGVPFIP